MNSDFLEKHNISTLVDLLMHRAETQQDKTAYIYLVDGENDEVKLTYGQLDKQARAIAAELQKQFQPGERALLIYPPGLEFITAFFGCLYAGIIAVPCYPPDPNKLNVSMAKLQAIIVDCTPAIILATREFLDLTVFIFPDYPDLEKMSWLVTDTVDINMADGWKEPEVSSESLSFLQYTSGSTGDPKGVMVSHGNVLYNNKMMHQAWRITEKSVTICWLPLYHDMGLIGNALQSVYSNSLVIIISPIAFLQKPIRWLKAISSYKATDCGAPNFAYDLLARRNDISELQTLDLSSWKFAINAAETVRVETLKRFAEIYKPLGFNEKIFYPCYGIAEATVFVSGGSKDNTPTVEYIDKTALKQNKVIFINEKQENSSPIVGCGRTWLDQKIIITDPEKAIRCLENKVGEIWISGPNVTLGYWNNPEMTKGTFHAYLSDTGEGPFLRTGDLGFIKSGELFVTGRLKDLIIIRGRNHYPQDIELTVEQSHQSLRPGCGAAFSIDFENEERLVVVQEINVTPLDGLDVDNVIEAIHRAVGEKHELQCYAVVLIAARSISRTSSAKIQRRACKQMFLENRLKIVAQHFQKTISTHKETDRVRESGDILKALSAIQDAETRLAFLKSYLKEKVMKVFELSEDEVDVDEIIISYASIDSVKVVELSAELESSLNTEINLENIFEESVATIARQIDIIIIGQSKDTAYS